MQIFEAINSMTRRISTAKGGLQHCHFHSRADPLGPQTGLGGARAGLEFPLAIPRLLWHSSKHGKQRLSPPRKEKT